MSQWSETYHLRGLAGPGSREDAIALLSRAKLDGYVVASSGGWVELVADGERCEPNERLIRSNTGELLYLLSDDDNGWCTSLYCGTSLVFWYRCVWGEALEIDDLGLVLDAMPEIRRLDEALRERIFHPGSVGEARGAPRLFAKAMNLAPHEWIAYEYLVGGDVPPGAEMVCAPDKTVGEWRQHCTPVRPSGMAIPADLCGTPAEVGKQWRQIARVAVRCGSWKEALAGRNWILFEHAPGLLVTGDGFGGAPRGEHVLAYMMGRATTGVVQKQYPVHADAYPVMKRLLLDGAADFWFCLCQCAEWWMPPREYERERTQVNKAVLPHVLEHWPGICACFKRLDWPRIPPQAGLVRWCYGLGHPKDEVRALRKLSAEQAGQKAAEWLKEA